MRLSDYIRLAIKNLSRQKSRTVLTIIAITVGSLSVILMVSLLLSVRQSLVDTFQKMGAFNLVTVTKDPNSSDNAQLITSGDNSPSSEGKKIDDKTFQSVRSIINVTSATPITGVWVKTMKLEGETKKMWSNLIAYQTDSEVFDIPYLAGRKLTKSDMDQIVVGWKFVQTYGYEAHPESLIGKYAILSFEGGGNAPDWGTPPQRPPQNAGKEWWDAQQNKNIDIKALIVGVADNRSMDDSQNYISIAWARRLMTRVYWKFDDNKPKENCQKNEKGEKTNCQELPTQATLAKEDQFTKSGYGSIILKVNDTANVAAVAAEVQKLGFGAVTAQNMINQMNNIFLTLGIILSTIGGISLFVAAIGIINTMIMATYERIREIGVLRACGATKGTIRHLFMIEAGLLGFFGGVFGLSISIILGQIARFLVQHYGANMGNIPLDNIGTFPLWLIAAVISFTTLIGIISGLYPAIKASRLNPVDALRYE